jgi:hypothetical protein
MTEEQQEHIVRIQLDFNAMSQKKFEAGAREHGGDLRDMTILQLIENAMDEAIDQFVYLHTAWEKEKLSTHVHQSNS